jgi:lysophospholipase L1-like esterase
MNVRVGWRLFALVALLALVCTATTAALSGEPVPPTAPETRTLVILGASYARGWGTPVLPGFDRVINRGVGGEETAGMLARFPADVAAMNPAAVLIWGHVNNITRARLEGIEVAKQAAREHYLNMIRQARAAGIEPIVATEVPWTETGGLLATLYGWYAALVGKTSYATRVSRHVHEVNEHLKALCKREECRVLDFEVAFAKSDGTRKSEYAAEDGSHISLAGYDALTAYATRELQRAQ